ncbi:hypothetical protein K474DRAFT_1712304 [Panus rudis PR-1116 ss-1]|nr:hypothetical protein K474DRAFT_1712304 [Panus rudis PR-1116 ss-1]
MREATPLILAASEHIHNTVTQVPAENVHYINGVHGFGRSVGPFPLSFFEKRFMKLRARPPPVAIPVPDDMFSGVLVTPEREMQRKWFKAVNDVGVFTLFELRKCSESIDPVSEIRLRPDLVLYCLLKVPTPLAFRWADMEILFEFKVEDLSDPHLVDAVLQNPETMPESDRNRASRKARGQITTYLGAQLSRQPNRVFAFALGLYGKHARAYLGDPSGLSFSEIIKYLERPADLIDFLRRYEQLSKEQRGLDPSVTTPTSQERGLFTKALNQFAQLASEGDVHRLPCMTIEELEGTQRYKVPIRDDKTKQTYHYIICKPLCHAVSPFGLFRQMYPTLRLDSSASCGASNDDEPNKPQILGKLFLMGDMWRYSAGPALSEMEVFKELNGLGVPHLAPLLFGGDVRLKNRKVQKTVIHELARKEYAKNPEGATGFHCLDELTHYHFVQGLAYPLSSCRSAQELVQVI